MRWITASAPCERSSPTRKYSKSYSDGTRKALAGLGRRIAYNRSFARLCRAYLPPPQAGAVCGVLSLCPVTYPPARRAETRSKKGRRRKLPFFSFKINDLDRGGGTQLRQNGTLLRQNGTLLRRGGTLPTTKIFKLSKDKITSRKIQLFSKQLALFHWHFAQCDH